jgi:hypothetical protein
LRIRSASIETSNVYHHRQPYRWPGNSQTLFHTRLPLCEAESLGDVVRRESHSGDLRDTASLLDAARKENGNEQTNHHQTFPMQTRALNLERRFQVPRSLASVTPYPGLFLHAAGPRHSFSWGVSEDTQSLHPTTTLFQKLL